MGKIITFEERVVKPKGLDKSALPEDDRIIKYFFLQDYANLSLLKFIQLPTSKTFPSRPTLFYPGCGSDILNPLIYVEKILPKIKEFNFRFNDINDVFGTIKTILDDIGISFKENKEYNNIRDNNLKNNNLKNDIKHNNNHISFYYKKILINLTFVEGSIFQLIEDKEKVPNFDIYFEKAFRIMKSYHEDYESKIVQKLNRGGILISDSGFGKQSLTIIPSPQELSSYKEMIIAVKH